MLRKGLRRKKKLKKEGISSYALDMRTLFFKIIMANFAYNNEALGQIPLRYK